MLKTYLFIKAKARMFLLLLCVLICSVGQAQTYTIDYNMGAGSGQKPTNPNPTSFEYTPGTTITLQDPGAIIGATFSHWEYWDDKNTRNYVPVTEIDCGWTPAAGFDKVYLRAVWKDFVTYTITYDLSDNPDDYQNDARNTTTYTIADNPVLYPITSISGHWTQSPGSSSGYWWHVYWEKNGTSTETTLISNYLQTSSYGFRGNLRLKPYMRASWRVEIRCEPGIVVTLKGLNRQVTADNPYIGTSSNNNVYQIQKDFDDWDDNYTPDGVEVTPAAAWDGELRLTITENTTITFKSKKTERNVTYNYLPVIFSYTPNTINPTDSTNLLWWSDPNRSTCITRMYTLGYDEPQTLTIPDNLVWESGWSGDITFEGWYKDSLLTVPANTTITIPANTYYRAHTHRELYALSQAGESTLPTEIQELTTFYAKWTSPIEYHDEGGGAYSGSNSSSLPVKDYWMPHVTLPDGVKEGYAFLGWYDNSACTGEPLKKAPGNYGYRTATNTHPIVYAKWQRLLQLEDKREDSYYADILANPENTGAISIQLANRTFMAGMWNTLCLPFNLSAEQLAESPLKDAKIYTFSNAAGNLQEYMDLEVVEVDEITAKQPYLIMFSGQNIVNPIFKNVTLADEAFTNNATGAGDRNIKFHGTLKPTDFPYHDPNYLFVGTGNNLYYSGVNGSKMPAFRAYFQVLGALQAIRPRANIVIKQTPESTENQETATEIDENSAQEESNEVRKYMENGILYIEHNGVRYNAQGARVD